MLSVEQNGALGRKQKATDKGQVVCASKKEAKTTPLVVCCVRCRTLPWVSKERKTNYLFWTAGFCLLLVMPGGHEGEVRQS